MKKLVSILFCAALCAALLSGCGSDSEPFSARSYTAEGEVSGVSIDVRDRSVEIIPSSDGQLRIDYFENSRESYDISVTDGMLTMAYATDKEWSDYIGGKAGAGDRKITLHVPQGLLSSLSVSTTNEDITVSELALGGEVSLYSNGGDILFDALESDSISLEAKNGDITGVISGSYDDYAISCEIKKGDSNLPASKDTGDKSLSVINNNGDIDVTFTGN